MNKECSRILDILYYTKVIEYNVDNVIYKLIKC